MWARHTGMGRGFWFGSLIALYDMSCNIPITKSRKKKIITNHDIPREYSDIPREYSIWYIRIIWAIVSVKHPWNEFDGGIPLSSKRFQCAQSFKEWVCNLHFLLVHQRHKPSFLLSNPWLALPGTVTLVVSMRFYPLVPNASLLAGFHLVFLNTRRVQKALSSRGLKASGNLTLSKVPVSWGTRKYISL